MNINSRTSKINFTGFTSGAIASFTGLREAPIKIRSYINSIQTGSGDPAPDNIRPIIGRDSVTITANSVDHMISLGDTCYGGSLDVTNGVLTVNRWFKQNTWGDGLNATDVGNNTRKLFKFESLGYNVYPPHVDNFPQLCNVAPYLASFAADSVHFYCNANECILFLPEDTPDDIIVQFSGELATPVTVQLTPTQIEQLLGANNVFADCGNVEVYYVTI